MADALLSDIDGTLVDNNALHADACRQIGKGGDQVATASKPEADSFEAADFLLNFARSALRR